MEVTQPTELEIPKPPPLLPSIERFLDALPQNQLKDLAKDLESCAICIEQFTDNADTEKPISLRCGHIFGSVCIKAWVSSTQVSQPTCPICRAALTPSSSIERWEYFATVMQQPLYTALCQTLRSTGISSVEVRYDSAVELVSLFYQVVMQILKHHRRHDIPASAFLIRSAQAAASRMGRLYIMLKPRMEIVGLKVPWDDCGPSVTEILDLKTERTFERTLKRMAQAERDVTFDWNVDF